MGAHRVRDRVQHLAGDEQVTLAVVHHEDAAARFGCRILNGRSKTLLVRSFTRPPTVAGPPASPGSTRRKSRPIPAAEQEELQD
jgi:hypothetical protein